MPSEPTRKLAAIMFTDMVGYTALMQENEPKARELIERHRAHMKPFVEKHGGEIIQFVGDGTFCRFDSAIEAVQSALEIQKVLEMEPEINLRIGIHVGDVVIDGDEVYGDGVNVASRIEPLAETGGICVSQQVYENIKNQPGLSLQSLGKKDLKNVDQDIEIFAVTTATEMASTPPDIQKMAPTLSKINLKWIGIAALIILLIVIGIKFDLGTLEVESREETNSLSIAVLPFENMSSDPENEFFADGITEDILTQLSKINKLKVISRTSTMQYKNTTKSMREIGIELNVSSILEGSVRRGNGQVRITAQLIDARTDEHLWAETYDRDLDNIFAIQSDVAKKIAAALEASLTPEEEALIDEKPTDNVEAYDLLLKGRYLSENAVTNREKGELEEAIIILERAVELDPEFIGAYSQLAISHLRMYWDGFGGWDRTDERLAKAKSALDKASEIDPEHPEVQLATGYYYYWGYRNYDEALKYLIPTLEKQPNNSDVLGVIGYVYRRNGNWTGAIESMQKSVDLDPHSHTKVRALARTYMPNRNWKQAERYIDRLILLKPTSITGHWMKVNLPINSEGDLIKSRMALDEAMKNIDPNKLIGMRAGLFYYERNFSEALNLIESDTANWYISKAFNNLKLGNLEAARSYFDSVKVESEDVLRKDPEDLDGLLRLGMAYAGLGKKEKAIEKALEAVELLPLSKDALAGANLLSGLAQIYVKVGEYDKAIDQLDLLLSIPSRITEHTLRLDPTWDPLREHPRFIKLIE